MRKTRGVKALVDYLTFIHYPMSESSIYCLIRVRNIPFRRTSPQVLMFDLDAVDNLLSSDFEETDQ